MSFRPSPCSAVSKNHAGRMFGLPDTIFIRWCTLSMYTPGSSGVPSIAIAEDGSIVHQLALEHARDLEPLRHDVVGDEAARVGGGERGVERRQVLRSQDPRLVREHVQAGTHATAGCGRSSRDSGRR